MSKHISKKLGKHLFDRAQQAEALNVELQEEINDLLDEIDELQDFLYYTDLQRSAMLDEQWAIWSPLTEGN